MEKRIEDIFANAPRVSLTADEKAAGREMLRSLIALRPLPVRTGWSFASFRGLSPAMVGKPAAVFATVLGLTFSAAGVSFAAEGAVPGDALYGVKVGVNENVRAAFAASAKDRAEWETERAERRLAEAETLAKRGTLKADVSADLAARFKAHAEDAQKQMADLRASSDEEDAADVGAHLEGTLRAHKTILAELHADEDAGAGDDDAQGDDEGKREPLPLAAIAASVDTEAASAVEERKHDEEKAASEQDAERAHKGVEGRRAAAEKKIADARATLDAMRATIGADAAAQADARLAAADAAVAQGDAAATAGDNRGAFADYLKAQRAAQEAKLLIKAKGDLQLKIDLGAPSADPQEDDSSSSRQTPGSQDGHGDATSQDRHAPRDARTRNGGDQRHEDGGDTRANEGDGGEGLDLHVGVEGRLRLR